jgi:hypothetical protein
VLLVAPTAGASTPPPRLDTSTSPRHLHLFLLAFFDRNSYCRLLLFDILSEEKIARVHRPPQVEIILRMRLHAPNRLPHPLFLTAVRGVDTATMSPSAPSSRRAVVIIVSSTEEEAVRGGGAVSSIIISNDCVRLWLAVVGVVLLRRRCQRLLLLLSLLRRR